VLCNANVVIEYNRRRSGLPSEPLDVEHGHNQDQDQDQDQLPSEPLDMEYDNNRTRDIAIALNIQHNPPLFAYLYICISASSHIYIFTYLHIHISTYSHIYIFTYSMLNSPFPCVLLRRSVLYPNISANGTCATILAVAPSSCT